MGVTSQPRPSESSVKKVSRRGIRFCYGVEVLLNAKWPSRALETRLRVKNSEGNFKYQFNAFNEVHENLGRWGFEVILCNSFSFLN